MPALDTWNLPRAAILEMVWGIILLFMMLFVRIDLTPNYNGVGNPWHWYNLPFLVLILFPHTTTYGQPITQARYIYMILRCGVISANIALGLCYSVNVGYWGYVSTYALITLVSSIYALRLQHSCRCSCLRRSDHSIGTLDGQFVQLPESAPNQV